MLNSNEVIILPTMEEFEAFAKEKGLNEYTSNAFKLGVVVGYLQTIELINLQGIRIREKKI